MKGKVNCTCGWSWNKSDSSKKDMYICHECGRDNSNNMKNGGWLDSIPQAQDGDTVDNLTQEGIDVLQTIYRNNPPSTFFGKLPFSLGSGIGLLQSHINNEPERLSDQLGVFPTTPTQIASLLALSAEAEKENMSEFAKNKYKGKDLTKLVSEKEVNNKVVDNTYVPIPKVGKLKEVKSKQIPYKEKKEFNKIEIDNTRVKKENGGWLDSYEDGGELNYNDSSVSMGPGFVGEGYDTTGRNYSPAWGGQFAMGGSLPGATGMMYARYEEGGDVRTKDIPSNGKYAKKTMASAQTGTTKSKDVRKPGQSIKLSGMINPGEVNYAQYTESLKGLSEADSAIEKTATKDFLNWYSDPATKEKFKKNTGLDPERVQDLIGKGLRTPMNLYDKAEHHDYPMPDGANASYKSAWVSKQQGDPTAPETGYISYLPQGNDIPELNVYSQPLKDIIGHELAHASGFDNVLAPALYRALDLKLPTKKELNDSQSSYMRRPEEVYGNFHELRLNLGLKPGEKVDRESLKKRVKDNPRNSTNFWRYYSTDDKTGEESDKKIDKIVKAINTVAYNPNKNTDKFAQNGQEMKFYQEGLDWKPKNISKNGAWLDSYEEGGIIKDDMGQYNHPGEITEIDSNQITMQGVPYPVLGISDTGDTQMMYPEEEYEFDGEKVIEYPMAKNGLRQEQKGLQNLDDLTNFTNYNKPNKNWLNKYN